MAIRSIPLPARTRALADLFAAGDHQATLAEARRFIGQFPQHYLGWKVAGACHESLFEFDAAAGAMEKAVRINPGDAEGLGNLAKVYKDQGRLAEALGTYRKAMGLQPGDTNILGKYLFLLNYFNVAGADEALREARRFGSLLSLGAADARYSQWAVPVAARPVRVGLVSGDLGKHPVGFFLEKVLAAIDPQLIEITAYPSRIRLDSVVDRLQSCCHAWKPIAGLSDHAAARLVHGDGIQILVDLSGLSAWHRLGVFAHKPAPVQMSWLGYFATTGLPEMDYLLADSISVPPSGEAHFCESVLRLPQTRLCYGNHLLDEAPPVASRPVSAGGQVTFGCFQNLSKITEDVVALWSRVLRLLPESRMRIQNTQLASEATRRKLVEWFERHSIAASRIHLHGPVSFSAYLRAHDEVDLIMDTFPFPGGTTTCEALWMGVPTLTLSGDRMISRQGHSLLHAVGLDEWVATDPEDYVAKAVSYASNSAMLAALRQGLRARAGESPLFDAPRFAAAISRVWLELAARHRAGGIS